MTQVYGYALMIIIFILNFQYCICYCMLQAHPIIDYSLLAVNELK